MRSGRLWALIIIIAIILFGTIAYLVWNQSRTKKAAPGPSPSVSASSLPEVWTKSDKKLFDNVTSTSTVKISDTAFRMYLMRDDQILYADSIDAENFTSPQPTGIKPDAGKIISNPAVVKVSDNSWVMVYEQAPKLPANVVKGPGQANQRDLIAATSTDGKSFQKAGTAIDSSKDDKFFASVPDLVLVKEGMIRLYFVSEGDKIASATSADGILWHREDGFRLSGSTVDPDVLLKTDADGTKHWVMYYATLEGAGNKIYKATSVDGLTWLKGNVVLRPTSSQGTVVDPDVVNISGTHYRMFFGEAANGNVQMGGQGQINLFFADNKGEIFK